MCTRWTLESRSRFLLTPTGVKLRYSTSALVERRDGVAAFEEIDKEHQVITHGVTINGKHAGCAVLLRCDSS